MNEIDSNQIPIVIAVTGHRDIRVEDVPTLKKQVGLIIADLYQEYPDTPLILQSPLAEGADQLVAEVALEKGVSLFVPLPMPIIEYEKGFTSKKSKDNFYELLKKAKKNFVLPQWNDSDKHEEIDANCQYAYLGAYLVHNSQILIALWDGDETGLDGGTSNVVSFKLKGVPKKYITKINILEPDDIGPVYHIVTPRSNKPEPEEKAFELIYRPDMQSKKVNDRILAQINEFNRVSKEYAPKIIKKIDQCKEWLLSEEKTSQLSEESQAIRENYALADSLALQFQRNRQWIFNTLFTLAWIGILSFEVYAHLFKGDFELLAVYPISLFIAFCIYLWVKHKRRDFHNKYLDYRALAEGMRVQFFWKLAGLKDEVADYYLLKQKSELQWIRKAIHNWNMLAHANNKEESGHFNNEQKIHCNYCITLEHWVDDQHKFFVNRVKKNHNKIRNHKRIIGFLFIGGLIIASSVVFLDLISRVNNIDLLSHIAGILFGSDDEEILRDLLIVCMGVLPAAAATIEGYDDKMAYEVQTKQYERMRDVFAYTADICRKYLKEELYTNVNEFVRELGKEALVENGDWVIMYRERPLGVPIPKK